MSFWLQHGYGKGSKIEDLAATADLGDGVILSPGDEGQSALSTTVGLVQSLGAEAVLDPQSYIYASPGCATRKHVEHGIEFTDMAWSSAPSVIDSHVDAVLSLNSALGVPLAIGPGPFMSTFDDRWTPLSIQYARAVAERDTTAYALLAVGEAGFSSWETVADWLDVFTTVDVAGVYLLVGRPSSSYTRAWSPEILANVLRAIHWLAERNGYEVIWGYSDVAGVLGVAAGARGGGSGWYHSLRYFSIDKWQPRTGGRSPKPRFFARPLLTSLDATGNARTLAESKPEALGATDDEIAALSEAAWSLGDSRMQHLRSIAQLYSEVDRVAGESKVAWVDSELGGATRLAAKREAQIVDPRVLTGLEALRSGLRTFAADEGIALA